MARKKISPPKKKRKSLHLNLSPEAKKSIVGTVFVFIAIFSIISLFGAGGQLGGGYANFLINIFGGAGAWVIIFLFALQGSLLITTDQPYPYVSTIVGGILFIFSSFGILELAGEGYGGALGKGFIFFPKKYLGIAGSWTFFLFIFLVSLTLLFNTSIFRKIYVFFKKRKEKKREKELERDTKLKEGEAEIKIKELVPQKEKLEEDSQNNTKEIIKKLGDKFVKHGAQESPGKYKYKSLPLALLDKEENQAIAGNIRANAQIIKRTFQNFGIEVEMGEINIGPTVTQYTLKPAEGVKVAKLLTLQRDLALSLAAHPIRMEAPIPGKSLVGIEVPNQKRAQVRLANLLGGGIFSSLSPLSISIGKDVMGEPYFADLERMPHLLVAGATGAGKTVFLNSLILSLLWRNSPDILRFVLIDPKRVEFTPYRPLPHLLCPPITQNTKVVPVVKWLIDEMETRFGILHDAGERNIISYNEMVAKKEKKNDNKEKGFQKLPYIVVIIDELADIMASRGKEFEAGIVRLAQMSRAVGIHLVLATQRPSVEVITGTIKANITSRIAFQVASQIDSRTVLDMAGAEKLLGQGDMLFLSGETGKPKRIQAAFISAQEVRKVVAHIEKTEKKTSEDLEESLGEALEKDSEQETLEFGGPDAGQEDDKLYEEAKMVVIRAKKASASLLQRRLKVGYARAARLLDMLEENGVIGPGQGAKPRDVYLSEEENEEENLVV